MSNCAKMYKHHSFSFSSKEIDQIVALLTTFMAHDLRKPVDARHLSKQVQRWAEGMGFLEWRNRDGACRWYDKGARLFYCNNLRYGFPITLIPAEALWRIIAPMLAISRGYGITRNPAWLTLNIDPVVGRVAENDQHREQSLHEMHEVLAHLANWGYIYYQHAATIWDISIIKQPAA